MDDQAFRPVAPGLDYTAVDESDPIAIAEDKQVAAAYFHKDWAAVEEMFVNEINRLNSLTAIDSNLSAEEYKIQGKANAQTASNLTNILARVKDAVQAVEQFERTNGRAKGGK